MTPKQVKCVLLCSTCFTRRQVMRGQHEASFSVFEEERDMKTDLAAYELH